ncbi:hypothetical protein CP533_1491 [Ophiocordyceps camponoti-saundersi (nom. inval.)]|nr:hypothetical protein CP533_1491 [Ophiocordyceps camponoti-saundersi (nom. inval.)]
MSSSLRSALLTSALLAAELVAGHSAITAAKGDAGGMAMALGVNPSTPRDGTNRNPFQQDSTRFRGASAQTFGETLAGGANTAEAGTQAMMAMTGQPLPQVSPGGTLTMTLHQVNGDGAGPYTCMINADGTGQDWQQIQVTQNVAGNNRGRNNAGAKTDNTLAVQVPAGQQCTGAVAGQNAVCMMRCQNKAPAGPFGGVVPMQIAGQGQAGQGAAGGLNGVAGGLNGAAGGAEGANGGVLNNAAGGAAGEANTGAQNNAAAGAAGGAATGAAAGAAGGAAGGAAAGKAAAGNAAGAGAAAKAGKAKGAKAAKGANAAAGAGADGQKAAKGAKGAKAAKAGGKNAAAADDDDN